MIWLHHLVYAIWHLRAQRGVWLGLVQGCRERIATDHRQLCVLHKNSCTLKGRTLC